MVYKHRYLENKVTELTASFGSILVTGPRQSGKTSLLSKVSRDLFGDSCEHISFDTPSEIDAFRRDPELFFVNHPGRLFLDEVQQVPDIFPWLKRELDRSPRSFRFFLSGSQHFELMKGVTESLAGRTDVLDLWPFSVMESRQVGADAARRTLDLLLDPARLEVHLGFEQRVNDPDDVVPAMLAGGYPPVVLRQQAGGDWLESYRRTYLHGDIRQLSQVGDLGRFDRLLTLCAGRSGTVINKNEIGRVLGVDHKTVDHWLSLLHTGYQVISLPAWHPGTTKRLVRRPKWIFADTGLALHLQGIRDAASLLNANNFGSLFESFVTMEIRKLFGHFGVPWSGSHWRTPGGLECDLVIEEAGRFVPIEIKHGAAVDRRDLNALHAFIEENDKRTPFGILLSLNPRVERVSKRVYAMPLGMLLRGSP